MVMLAVGLRIFVYVMSAQFYQISQRPECKDTSRVGR